ncbi:MAG TPA: 3-phosphoshikimate 1-carboxyvinyltransferase, partial [Desulfonauticus sp.]|nr:3-phosphoshikimate 1-carboxyvinyltransferase [Desulfonauticus sp.]
MAAKQEPIVLQAPSSKSLSHRALLLASLAKGISQLDKVLVSEDILRTRECLQALGVEIEENSGVLRVKGKGRDFHFSSLVKLMGGES